MTNHPVLTREQIRECIRKACADNDMAWLEPFIVVSWNNRFTNRMGDANAFGSCPQTMQGVGTSLHMPLGKRPRIRLSSVLFPRAAQDKQRNTVIHEACHIIANVRAGRRVAHGDGWKIAMRRAGQTPKRCYDRSEVDRTGIDKCVKAFCGCKGGARLGPVQAKKARSGRTVYRCNRCSQRISLTDPAANREAVRRALGGLPGVKFS